MSQVSESNIGEPQQTPLPLRTQINIEIDSTPIRMPTSAILKLTNRVFHEFEVAEQHLPISAFSDLHCRSS